MKSLAIAAAIFAAALTTAYPAHDSPAPLTSTASPVTPGDADAMARYFATICRPDASGAPDLDYANDFLGHITNEELRASALARGQWIASNPAHCSPN